MKLTIKLNYDSTKYTFGDGEWENACAFMAHAIQYADKDRSFRIEIEREIATEDDVKEVIG